MEVVGRKKYSCKYPGCNNWYYVKISEGFVNKHFFCFPKNVNQIQLWKGACKIDEVQNTENWKICEDHFEATSFLNERKERLNPGCVPKPYGHSSFDHQDHCYCGTEEQVNEEVIRDVCSIPTTSEERISASVCGRNENGDSYIVSEEQVNEEVIRDVSSIPTNSEERISAGVSDRNKNGDSFTFSDLTQSPPRTSETGVQTSSKLLQSHRIIRRHLSEIRSLRKRLQSLKARSRKPTLRRITKQEFYEFVDRHFDENFGKFIKVEYLLNRN